MNEEYSLYCKIHFVYQNEEKIDFQMFVIHLNGTTLRTLLLQILVTCGQSLSLYGQILLPK